GLYFVPVAQKRVCRTGGSVAEVDELLIVQEVYDESKSVCCVVGFGGGLIRLGADASCGGIAAAGG
ncbi:MAG: hypothetical protein LBS57_13255, partial [Treponema sp.]|nr:hypothetical protein [Treponema sp.]